MKQAPTASSGERAENRALSFLVAQKLRCVERNYRCRWGEIDLIMQDQDTLVFVEVRYRKNRQFGGAIASVNTKKQSKLARAALHYLGQSRKGLNTPCRFDVIALDHGVNNQPQWLKHAFEIDSGTDQ